LPVHRNGEVAAQSRSERDRWTFYEFIILSVLEYPRQVKGKSLRIQVEGNPSVTGASCYEWRTGVKAERCPGLGARPVPLES
jgi:hypothetical protein